MFELAPGERLSPFLFNSNEFDAAKKIVRHEAFMPPKNLRKSAYWVSKLSGPQIWSIGMRFVEPFRGKPIRARAVIDSRHVYATGLKLKLTSRPHPRHLNIIGWSGERIRDRKDALKLANASRLIVNPGTATPSSIELRQDSLRDIVSNSILIGGLAALVAGVLLVI